MAEGHIMIYNYFSSFNLALQICLKKELRLIELCLMAAGHIMIYSSFLSFNLALQFCLKKRVEAHSILSHGRRPHYDL
jgi:hypothetical protein